MSRQPLTPVVLGHNAFFGVNHLSGRAGRERAVAFHDSKPIVDFIRHAQRHGVRGLMLSTHPRSRAVCDQLRGDRRVTDELRVYPLLPYAQKYVLRANEVGLMRAATETLRLSPLSERIKLGRDALRLLLRRDTLEALRGLIRVELGAFRWLDTHAVFLHDAFTDLVLALDAPGAYEVYADCLRRQLRVEVGLATKNLPLLLARMSRWGVPVPHVLTHVNSAGFQMHPHRDTCIAALESDDLSVMAMGTLASGHIAPDAAFGFLRGRPAIKSVCVGMSRLEHLKSTIDALHDAGQRE